MKKIAFSDRYGLTQAVVDLIKTNTRRLEKSLDILPLEYNPLLTEFQFEYKDGIIIGRRLFKGFHVETYHLKPRYKIGEVVAVAQRYKDIDERGIVGFKDGSDIQPGMVSPIFAEQSAGWTNKMFVRADLMPHRIRITDIKVERLQDISEEDCMKEGVEKWIDCYIVSGIMESQGKNNVCFEIPHAAFAALIDRISGRGTWERNPWVYAYSFELVKEEDNETNNNFIRQNQPHCF